ncbi:MAG TPA: L,D-transpeptidase [Chthoniobacterales bacterium]|nr:L,D-transpeptidase [Chthoniobacterales bacterium]
MRPLVSLQLFVISLSLPVPVVSGSQASASPSPSPAQTSSAVATYARTYYARSSGAASPNPAASPNAATSPTRPVVSITPAPAPTPSVQLVVSVSDQKLAVVVNGKIFKDYRISTSRYGEGDNWGSWRTPTGMLQIAGKIGASAPAGAVFSRRQVTGEVLPANAPGRDPIVSRIIWLRGLEEANRNAYKRCIYIHGTPQEAFLGRKASFGCIRMRSADVIEVFNWVSVGTPVAILQDPLKRAVKEADKNVTVLAQNSPAPVRNEPVAKNVPPRTIAARENIAAEAKVSEVSKAADAAKTADATKTADVSKVTDYRIPSPTIQIQRVGPPDPTVTVGHKNTTASN